MSDLFALRNECEQLAVRLEGQPSWNDLNRIFLDLSPLVGRLQAAVGESYRDRDATSVTDEADALLQTLKRQTRHVGSGIRLASPGALAIGLSAALECAVEILARLERAES